MPWNPDVYNEFKEIRYRPFFVLAELITAPNIRTGIDIGCGTGEQTRLLSEKFIPAYFLGIDSSEEMLSQARQYESETLQFRISTIEEFADTESTWDLIFSNAALQWADDHEVLFPKLIARLNDDGQFAVQMPVQKENLLNQILLDLVQKKPYADFLKGWKRKSPVLSMDAYANIFYDSGLRNIQIIQKVYPIIADNPETLFNFISGSALIPYMERMSEDEYSFFANEYKGRIVKEFKRFPAIYAFKRLLMYGKK